MSNSLQQGEVNEVLLHAQQWVNLTNSESKHPTPMYMNFKNRYNQSTVIEIRKAVKQTILVTERAMSEFYGLLVTFYTIIMFTFSR